MTFENGLKSVETLLVPMDSRGGYDVLGTDRAYLGHVYKLRTPWGAVRWIAHPDPEKAVTYYRTRKAAIEALITAQKEWGNK